MCLDCTWAGIRYTIYECRGFVLTKWISPCGEARAERLFPDVEAGLGRAQSTDGQANRPVLAGELATSGAGREKPDPKRFSSLFTSSARAHCWEVLFKSSLHSARRGLGWQLTSCPRPGASSSRVSTTQQPPWRLPSLLKPTCEHHARGERALADLRAAPR